MPNWGSTPAEQGRTLPGDHLVPDPTCSTTHAITINAPPEVIWPWWQTPFRLLLFEPLHVYMETGVLSGIKSRLEVAVDRHQL